MAKDLGIKLALYADPVSGAKTLVFRPDDAAAIGSLMTILLRRMGFAENEARAILDPNLGASLEGEFTMKGISFKSDGGVYRHSSQDDEGGTIDATVERVGNGTWKWTLEHIMADGTANVEEHVCKAKHGTDGGSALLECALAVASHAKASEVRAERARYPHTPEQNVRDEQAREKRQSRGRQHAEASRRWKEKREARSHTRRHQR